MKKGLLIYDKADSEYNSWFIKKLITEGAKEGLKIELVLTEDLLGAGSLSENKLYEISKNTSLENAGFAILRNRNHQIARLLENKGVRCFNSSDVIELGNDKWVMHERLKEKNIPLMHTQRTKLPYPFVLKKRNGHGGTNVYLVSNVHEYDKVRDAIWKEYTAKNNDRHNFKDVDELITGMYIYQFKASQTGRDIRVYVLGGNILTAMERTSGIDFRANFSLGGNACEYALNDDELRLAARTADIIKPDFIGIDIIYNNGSPVVNEIEDAAGTRMLYEKTDIDAAREYIKHISRVMNSC